MDKNILQPLSGFRDYRGDRKYQLITQLQDIFQSYGYEGLETPSLERKELLLASYGEDAQKLLYLFKDNGGREVGLRYDLTLPLARFVAANKNDLPFPYKRYEIGSAWRAERAQRGRLRQFTQADIDIVGITSLEAEKELLQIIARVIEATSIPLTSQINDRKIITRIFETIGILPTDSRLLIRLLDKKDKLTPEAFSKELRQLPFSDSLRKKICGIFLGESSLDEIRSILKDSSICDEVEELLDYARSIGLSAVFVPSMVRGLDYYTGVIIECLSPSFPSSLVGGGRYDRLIESFIEEKIPSVGVSFGIDRMIDAQEQLKLTRGIGMFVVAVPETYQEVKEWVEELRTSGQAIELYLDPDSGLGKQIKYADKKGYSEIYIPFLEDWRKNKIVKKNLKTGNQILITRNKPQL